MEKQTILLVDDDVNLNDILQVALKKQGYEVFTAADGKQAIERVQAERPFAVLLDVYLPDMDGIQVLKEIKKIDPHLHVIMISAYATIDIAIEAVKRGAHDFLAKPFKMELLLLKLEQLELQAQIEQQLLDIRRELKESYQFKRIVGKSAHMKNILKVLEVASKNTINVLITGESGTGKELIARAIHYTSDRKDKPFVAVNCIAIPEHLLESELFGYEKGAFTGALTRRIGKFERAQGGTIFLDEIGDLSSVLQGKLLRVIQEREIERLGGGSVPLDVRFIFATNRNLRELVSAGQFREDLFFRINVLPLHLPPLRERIEDLPELLNYFFQKDTAQASKQLKVVIDPEVLHELKQHSWPGNIRELENFVQRILAVKGDENPIHIMKTDLENLHHISATPSRTASPVKPSVTISSFEDAEKKLLMNTLKETSGNLSKAAKILAVSRQTLYRKIKKHNLDLPSETSA